MNNSYYGLINRYKELFSISTQNAEGDFEDDFQGNYFEDLLSIYDFDKNLSSLLYKYFSMIETTLKTSCSYYISLYIGEMQTNYLNKNNYSWGYIVEHGKWNGNSFFDKFYKVQNFFPYAIPIVLDNEPPRM